MDRTIKGQNRMESPTAIRA